MKDKFTTEKLIKAFMQFNKSDWHKSAITGQKPSDIMVLFTIKNNTVPNTLGLMVSEISNYLHVTSPTITQLIKGLEAQGLVERNLDEADRRVVRIRLTDKGLKITEKASQAFKASFNGLVEYLGEEQSNQLAELLSKVFVYFNEKAPKFNKAQFLGDDQE